MSNNFLNRVWPLELEPMEKFVMVALADRADEKGVCWPSVKDLERRTCLSRRTIQRSISSLENKGHLSRAIIPGKKCGYVIHPRQPDTPETEAPRQGDTLPASQGHPTGVTVTPYPRQGDAQTIIEPSREPSEEPSSGAHECATGEIGSAEAGEIDSVETARQFGACDDWVDATELVASVSKGFQERHKRAEMPSSKVDIWEHVHGAFFSLSHGAQVDQIKKVLRLLHGDASRIIPSQRDQIRNILRRIASSNGDAVGCQAQHILDEIELSEAAE